MFSTVYIIRYLLNKILPHCQPPYFFTNKFFPLITTTLLINSTRATYWPSFTYGKHDFTQRCVCAVQRTTMNGQCASHSVFTHLVLEREGHMSWLEVEGDKNNFLKLSSRVVYWLFKVTSVVHDMVKL